MRHLRAARGELAVCAASIAVIAAAGLALQPSASASDSASALLARVAHADAPYRAEQLVTYFGHPQSNALLHVSSSRDGRYVRAESGEDVTRMWSSDDLGVVVGREADLEEAAPPPVRVRPDEVLAKYDVKVERPESLLGVELVPLTFTRRHDERTIERWWVHAKSGVVYRRTLYGADGGLVGMSTVIDMKWGDPGPSEDVRAGAQRLSQVRPVAAPQAPELLPGGYRLWETYALRVAGRRCEQWLYSDGLHALSIFRTKGNLKAPADFVSTSLDGAQVWTGPGPGTWAWQGAGRSWLVVAEEPAIDARELIAPFPKGGPSAWARMGSVWSRIIGAIARLL